jgi:hypothetical protein
VYNIQHDYEHVGTKEQIERDFGLTYRGDGFYIRDNDVLLWLVSFFDKEIYFVYVWNSKDIIKEIPKLSKLLLYKE